jgi:hypothetical protein
MSSKILTSTTWKFSKDSYIYITTVIPCIYIPLFTLLLQSHESSYNFNGFSSHKIEFSSFEFQEFVPFFFLIVNFSF